MQEQEKHLFDYLFLLIGLVVLFLLFYFFRYNPTARILIGLGSVVFYMLWGVVHHAVEGRFKKGILLEYFLVGLFVFVLLFIVSVF